VAADSKAKLLDDAERYVFNGKYRLAISAYLKIINLDPNDVLILNTIGDLYLRQGNWVEANNLFLRVADNYVHNNFLLKAIAVYKKILNSDPDNLEVNTTMAGLYVKQGLNLDAGRQYLRVIELLEREGKSKEALSIYEKIAELDPLNSAIQQKLAELHAAAGAKEKARAYWSGAARAQVKSKNTTGACHSYLQALQIDPLDIQSIRGIWDCCLKTGNFQLALDQLQKASELAPQNLDIREMLGQAYLEMGDCESAAKAFQMAISMDESRYANFFLLAQALTNKEAYDQAAGCLDGIIPVLIAQRDTDRAIKQYQQILQRQPKHLLSLIKLASLYSAIGYQSLYLDVCDELAECYLADNRPVEALEYIEKILQADPENEKHRQLHQQAFLACHSDVPYEPPPLPAAPIVVDAPAINKRESVVPGEEGVSENIVEVDLLLNYGLKDKAFSILLNLETKDPCDKEVRGRLISIYKAEGKYEEAANQYMLLAALYSAAGNKEEMQSCLAEAKQLVPELEVDSLNLAEFGRTRGIVLAESAIPSRPPFPAASSANTAVPDDVLELDPDIDLSSDLMNTFFGQAPGSVDHMTDAHPEIVEPITEEFPAAIPSIALAKSLEEQFQEVDFYIRLGFNDEALAKLGEIARIDPDNPELAVRYEKLGTAQTEAAETEPVLLNDSSDDTGLFGTGDSPEEANVLPSSDALNENEDLNRLLQIFAEETPPVQDLNSASEGGHPVMLDALEARNADLFADLMNESNPANQEAADSFFEEHFSLGTAYREMELMEEAIKEFEIAFKSIETQKGNPHIVQCCGMLSTCFLKKNMPQSVLQWCRTGLQKAEASSHEALALRYDMGLAHIMAGSNEQALECFNEIMRLNPGYRDVESKIDELADGFAKA
jgi:tetratricopeptide (TPR) repeat protein